MIAELVHWDPELTAGEFLVALGTLALAWFTWRLARKTSAEVEQTKRSVDLSEESIALARESIEAADRPYFVPVEKSPFTSITFRHEKGDAYDPGRDEWRYYFTVWNVGSGPGIMERLCVRDQEGRELLEIKIAYPAAAGHRIDVDGTMEAGPLPGIGLVCEIDYRSASGTLYRTTVLLVVVQAGVTSYRIGACCRTQPSDSPSAETDATQLAQSIVAE